MIFFSAVAAFQDAGKQAAEKRAAEEEARNTQTDQKSQEVTGTYVRYIGYLVVFTKWIISVSTFFLNH